MYIDKENGKIVTLEEIKKEYFEIKSNIDFIKEKITGWETFEKFLADCYEKSQKSIK